MWVEIRPAVKAWCLENWERWEQEKPDWFTETWKSKLDDDMVPPESLRRLKMAGGGKRRRNSLSERFSVREHGQDMEGLTTIRVKSKAGKVAPTEGEGGERSITR